MPAFLIAKLKKEAAKKGLDPNAYAYGTMNNMGAMHGNKETEKGREMQKKHDEKVGKK